MLELDFLRIIKARNFLQRCDEGGLTQRIIIYCTQISLDPHRVGPLAVVVVIVVAGVIG